MHSCLQKQRELDSGAGWCLGQRGRILHGVTFDPKGLSGLSLPG